MSGDKRKMRCERSPRFFGELFYSTPGNNNGPIALLIGRTAHRGGGGGGFPGGGGGA
jgi:hypothetical protein